MFLVTPLHFTRNQSFTSDSYSYSYLTTRILGPSYEKRQLLTCIESLFQSAGYVVLYILLNFVISAYSQSYAGEFAGLPCSKAPWLHPKTSWQRPTQSSAQSVLFSTSEVYLKALTSHFLSGKLRSSSSCSLHK